MPQPARLRRTLGFWALTVYGVGDILGAGIYALVGKVAGVAGGASWLAFGVALLAASLTALAYAELGGRFPRSAGEALFSERAFGRPALSVLVGWLVLCSSVLSLATVSVAFSGYVGGVLPQVVPKVAVVSILLLLAAINFRGIRESSLANVVATAVELVGLLIVIVGGAIFLVEEPSRSLAQTVGAGREVGWTAVAQGGALAFFAFIGFEDMVNVAEEVTEPKRNLPRAIVAALVFTGAVYLLVVLVATSIVDSEALSQSDAALLTVVQRSMGSVPDRAFALIALFAVANTGLLNFITGSRLLYGMSQQGLLPGWLGEVHSERRTPHRAVLVILVLALALALSGTLTYLAGTTSLLLLGVFFVVNLSLIVIKRRDARPGIAFRVPMVVPVLGAATCLGLMPFVPRASLVTAVAILSLGLALALTHRKAVSR